MTGSNRTPQTQTHLESEEQEGYPLAAIGSVALLVAIFGLGVLVKVFG